MVGRVNPRTHAIEVVPSDSDTANNVFSAPVILSIGVSGDVRVTTVSGSTVTFKNRPSGSELPYEVRKVWQTGTTASSIVAGQ